MTFRACTDDEVAPTASVTRTSKVLSPGVVGSPEIWPLAGSSVIPAGSEPPERANL